MNLVGLFYALYSVLLGGKKRGGCPSPYPVFWSKPGASVSLLCTGIESWKLLQKAVQYSRRVWYTLGLGEGRWGEGVKIALKWAAEDFEWNVLTPIYISIKLSHASAAQVRLKVFPTSVAIWFSDFLLVGFSPVLPPGPNSLSFSVFCHFCHSSTKASRL